MIFISALNDTQNIVKGFELGAVDYITKPFQSEEVLARLNNQLTIQFQARKLEEKNHELTQLNSMKNKFFSIIAHDIKNPFSGILGISEILYEDFHTYSIEEVKEMIGQLHSASKKCYKLLENLLSWANSQLNNIKINPAQHNLLNHVKETVELFKTQAENKKIQIQYSIEPSLTYYADKNLIDTVLRNLINNAIKFTPQNGEVQIFARPISDKIEIQVSDTGIGIPKEIQQQLFQVGAKVTRKGTEKEDGTGLGLILCYEFIQKSKGKIRVESEVGKGSHFFIELPTHS
ncbi:MAG: hybrid sensor histidine kinase/response regulator [Leptospiraceae bacterium]|nr:hybrid sensor histidine kinase/response regulator [Leptospiraceae bacterium]